MGAASRFPISSFATVWASTWLRQSPYRRRPSGFAARAMSALWRSHAPQADAATAGAGYFSRLADLPDLPQNYKVRALSIVMHQHKEAALQRLVTADEA